MIVAQRAVALCSELAVRHELILQACLVLYMHRRHDQSVSLASDNALHHGLLGSFAAAVEVAKRPTASNFHAARSCSCADQRLMARSETRTGHGGGVLVLGIVRPVWIGSQAVAARGQAAASPEWT